LQRGPPPARTPCPARAVAPEGGGRVYSRPLTGPLAAATHALLFSRARLPPLPIPHAHIALHVTPLGKGGALACHAKSPEPGRATFGSSPQAAPTPSLGWPGSGENELPMLGGVGLAAGQERPELPSNSCQPRRGWRRHRPGSPRSGRGPAPGLRGQRGNSPASFRVPGGSGRSYTPAGTYQVAGRRGERGSGLSSSDEQELKLHR